MVAFGQGDCILPTASCRQAVLVSGDVTLLHSELLYTTMPYTVCAFAGSLRSRSYNRALLRAAVEESPDDLTIKPFDLRDIPLYNGDVEAEGDPEPVQALKNSIHEADGLLIVTPEYNASIAAVTKNAVDWASRPPKPTALDGKPVALAGATPSRLSTARAQAHLRVSLSNTNALVMPQPQFYVGSAGDLFDDDLNLTDAGTLKVLRRFLAGFAQWIERVG